MAATEYIRFLDANVEMLQDLHALQLRLGRFYAETIPERHELFQAIEDFAACEDDTIVLDGDASGDVVIVVISQNYYVDAAETQLTTESLKHVVTDHFKRLGSEDRNGIIQF